ncbi:F-box domain containing protein [Parasponia andersonii]|uniref:F-box domain containing protein n=1 Tax=Parasponia andersonii TaxID=3476 RepID=A0A2P5D308_PARAD|nr:F-box domain containing protein [Parasponia andersonii]
MARLPLEMINEIICRLRVKDLLRYRSVCKEWCSLMDGPGFIRTHFKRSKPGIFIDDYFNLYWVDLDSLDSPIRLDKSEKYTKLPFNNTDSPYPPAVIGFGYDPFINDHKLLTSTIISRGKDMSDSLCEFQLYCVKAKTWERLTQDFSDNFGYDDFGRHALVSTSLYWLVMPRRQEAEHGSSTQFVFAFDLVTYKVSKFSLPNFEREPELCTLGVELGGCLCLLCPYNEPERSLDNWVMKDLESSLGPTWAKQFSVARSDGPGYFVYGVPLKYYKTTDQLLLYVDCERLILYDLRTKTTKDVKIPGIPESVGALLGVRSLVGI